MPHLQPCGRIPTRSINKQGNCIIVSLAPQVADAIKLVRSGVGNTDIGTIICPRRLPLYQSYLGSGFRQRNEKSCYTTSFFRV